MRIVFQNRKAERRFVNIYYKLTKKKQKIFGQMVRDFSKEKVEGDGYEFYVTVKDVNNIYISLIEDVRFRGN